MLHNAVFFDISAVAEVNGEIKQLEPEVRNQRVMRIGRTMITLLFQDLIRI